MIYKELLKPAWRVAPWVKGEIIPSLHCGEGRPESAMKFRDKGQSFSALSGGGGGGRGGGGLVVAGV